MKGFFFRQKLVSEMYIVLWRKEKSSLFFMFPVLQATSGDLLLLYLPRKFVCCHRDVK